MSLLKDFRLSFLPPLMIYFAAGISGFTAIVESFFIKEKLGLSASYLAGLAFWVGLPFSFKMPLGHLVDLFWEKKSWFVYLGSAILAASLLIMVGLTGDPAWMARFLTLEQWFVISSLLAPIGFAFQDVVADAMTVEAVPAVNAAGQPIPEKTLQEMHMTMQTLGRVAIIGGSALVAGAAGWLANIFSYQTIYQMALILPVISVTGVILHAWIKLRRQRQLRQSGMNQSKAETLTLTKKSSQPDWKILGGSAALILVIIAIGLSTIPIKEELVFIFTLGVVVFLMRQLVQTMDVARRREIVAIAAIIFIFRATPTTGAGASWWEIDVLGFDESFFGTLQQISAILAIVGMLSLRGWMSRHPLPYIVVFLTIVGTALSLPIIGMYYGFHQWTQTHLGIGARSIALIDIAVASPLGQVAMVPMLAWIAEKSPLRQKATYFAVFSAFTNLALSAGSLLTKHINQLFVIERGDYSRLGTLMVIVLLINFLLPIAAVIYFHPKKQRRSLKSVPML